MATRDKAALTAVGEKLAPGPVKPSRSAAELAYSQAEGYADEGFAEHKVRPYTKSQPGSLVAV